MAHSSSSARPGQHRTAQRFTSKLLHWTLPGEFVTKWGRVYTQCGVYVDEKTQVSFDNPTCERCREAMERYHSQ